jgi:hypothetical protein
VIQFVLFLLLLPLIASIYAIALTRGKHMAMVLLSPNSQAPITKDVKPAVAFLLAPPSHRSRPIVRYGEITRQLSLKRSRAMLSLSHRDFARLEQRSTKNPETGDTRACDRWRFRL